MLKGKNRGKCSRNKGGRSRNGGMGQAREQGVREDRKKKVLRRHGAKNCLSIQTQERTARYKPSIPDLRSWNGAEKYVPRYKDIRKTTKFRVFPPRTAIH